MRTPPPIPMSMIAEVVRAVHGIDTAVYTFVRGGEEAWGFNVASPSGSYRLKIYSAQHDIDRRLAAAYHLEHVTGLPNVVAAIRLPDGGFTFEIANYRAALFRYVLASPSNIHPMNESQALELGRTLAAIHMADLGDLIIPVETFSTTAADEVEAVLKALPAAAAGTHPARKALANLLMPVQDKLQESVALLRETAAAAKAADLPMVVCHGDPGAENILVGDSVYLIDWDDMRLGPKEIDLMHFEEDSLVMAGYREATGMSRLNDVALRFCRALWNNEDIAGFAGRALFHDLSGAQYEHNIATLRNILRYRGIEADRH